MSHIEFSGSVYFHLILALLFVVLNAFFVAAEFALVKIRVTRLEILAKKGNPLARMVQGMVDKLDPYLSATQLGITLASLGLGWVGEPAVATLFKQYLNYFGGHIPEPTLHSLSFIGAFAFISALHIVFGELVPKTMAIRTAETICFVVAIPMRIFYVTFFPFLWLLNGASNLILKPFRYRLAAGPGRAHSEEEIKLVVEDSFEEGVIGSRKRALLDKAIDFSHKAIRDLMIPADRMICFYLDESVHHNLERAKEWGHTRFPLRASQQGVILGFVHMKDVIWQLENQDIVNLFDLRRPVIFFPPETRCDNALREFQKKSIHMGIVSSEKNEILGLITLEDVIEQLVGAIQDEFDEGEGV